MCLDILHYLQILFQYSKGNITNYYRKGWWENSPAVQWLELGAAGARIQSQVRELRPCKLCDTAKK